MLWIAAAFAQAPHYPGAWIDDAATRREMAGAATRGIANLTVFGSNDRIERVDAFYRQFLQPLPGFVGRSRFCLDHYERPQDCRRFVELEEAGGGSRIRVYELR